MRNGGNSARPHSVGTIELFTQIVRGGGWALLGRCGAVAGLMLMNALLTRLLSPSDVGAFFLIFSVVVAVGSLAQLGLPLAIVNLVGDAMGRNQPGRVRAAIAVSTAAACTALLAASLIIFIFGPWLAVRVFRTAIIAPVMKVAAAWLIVRGLQTLLSEVFRALKDLRGATIHSGLLSTLGAVLALAAIWRAFGRGSLIEVLWISIAAGALDAALAVIVLSRRLKLQTRAAGSIALSEIMRNAWPLWGALMVWTLGRENDVWVLGMFRAPSEIALYGAAVRLAALASMPLMVVNAVVPPFIAELHGGRHWHALELMLRATASAALLPTLCILAVFIFEGRTLLAMLFGPFYADANRILLIWGFSALADVATGACGLTLMMTGRGSQVLWISLGGAILALAIKLALVQRYGGVGVAIGAVLGFTAQNFAMLFAVRRELGIWTSILSLGESAPAARIFLARLRQPLTT